MIKKASLLVALVCLSLLSSAQIISTYAGNGVSGDSGDGDPATSASIGGFSFSTFDKNENYFFSERGSHKIRKISNSGVITTIAGIGISGFSGDGGAATLAKLNNPIGIACDHFGNLYIADLDNNRIRKIDNVTGVISTLAGNGASGHTGDGEMATNASINAPTGICVDPFNNIFFTEIGSNTIRKITAAGIISTYAGTTNVGGTDSGDGGLATAATIASPEGICSDALGNIYFATSSRIRKILASSDIVISIAGTNASGFSGDGGLATNAVLNSPLAVAVDKYGNIFIADKNNNRIRQVASNGIINTIIGDGVGGYNGDNQPATTAEIYSPEGVSLDSCNNIYVSDLFNFRVRKITYDRCDYLQIKNQNSISNIDIYPNPTTNELQIDNIAIPTIYKIYNLVGTTLQQGTLKERSNIISIRAIPAGMYLLEMVDEEGNKTTKKIIKE